MSKKVKAGKKSKGLKDQVVTITYKEYAVNSVKKPTRFSISVDPMVIPVRTKGEQVKWLFKAKGTSALCKVLFSPQSPFGTPNPSPIFGPGAPNNTSSHDSGPCTTKNDGPYKYAIEIMPSSSKLGGPIVIDPEVEIWVDNPQGNGN